MKTSYKITRGWISEDKFYGLGDGADAEIETAETLEEAKRIFAELVASCRGTKIDGRMIYRDTVEIFEVDADGEPIAQPLASYRSP
jgi:hypothetical protein